MFITGPDVIKTVTGEEVEFEELGGAMTHNSKSGVAHFAAEDEDALLEDTRYLLRLPAPEQPREAAARRARRRSRPRGRRARHASSRTTRTSPTTCARSSSSIVDDGEFFEVHEHWAKNIICGFSRLDGLRRSASSATSRRQIAGVLDIDASAKARALRAHLRRLQHPDPHLLRRPRLPARARARSGAASSATGRSCSTPTPRRRSRRSPSSRARPTAAPTTSWPPSTCSPTSTSPGRRPRSR